MWITKKHVNNAVVQIASPTPVNNNFKARISAIITLENKAKKW